MEREQSSDEYRKVLLAHGLRRHVDRAVREYLTSGVRPLAVLEEVIEDFARHLLFSHEDPP